MSLQCTDHLRTISRDGIHESQLHDIGANMHFSHNCLHIKWNKIDDMVWFLDSLSDVIALDKCVSE